MNVISFIYIFCGWIYLIMTTDIQNVYIFNLIYDGVKKKSRMALCLMFLNTKNYGR